MSINATRTSFTLRASVSSRGLLLNGPTDQNWIYGGSSLKGCWSVEDLVLQVRAGFVPDDHVALCYFDVHQNEMIRQVLSVIPLRFACRSRLLIVPE